MRDFEFWGLGMIHLTEPAIIPDVFASGLAEAEDLGDGNMRLTLYTKQRSAYDGASMDNVIVARIVMPMQAAIIGSAMALKAAGLKCCGARRLN